MLEGESEGNKKMCRIADPMHQPTSRRCILLLPFCKLSSLKNTRNFHKNLLQKIDFEPSGQCQDSDGKKKDVQRGNGWKHLSKMKDVLVKRW